MRTEENLQYEAAKRQVKKIRGFYIHLAIYIFLNIMFFVVGTWEEGLLAGMQDLSNYATAFFWGLACWHTGPVSLLPIFSSEEGGKRKRSGNLWKKKNGNTGNRLQQP